MPPTPAGRGAWGAAGSPLLSPQCTVVPDVCFSTSKSPRCVNTDPGFHCLPCPPRYKGTQPFGVGLEAAQTEKQVGASLRLSENQEKWGAQGRSYTRDRQEAPVQEDRAEGVGGHELPVMGQGAEPPPSPPPRACSTQDLARGLELPVHGALRTRVTDFGCQ